MARPRSAAFWGAEGGCPWRRARDARCQELPGLGAVQSLFAGSGDSPSPVQPSGDAETYPVGPSPVLPARPSRGFPLGDATTLGNAPPLCPHASAPSAKGAFPPERLGSSFGAKRHSCCSATRHDPRKLTQACNTIAAPMKRPTPPPSATQRGRDLSRPLWNPGPPGALVDLSPAVASDWRLRPAAPSGDPCQTDPQLHRSEDPLRPAVRPHLAAFQSEGKAAGDQTTRSTIIFLISAMALAGFSPLGQVEVQFMIVWQRYSLNGSCSPSSRSPVISSRESMIQR